MLGSAQAYRALLPLPDLMTNERARTDLSMLTPKNIYGSSRIFRKVQQLEGEADTRPVFPEISTDKNGKLNSFLNQMPAPAQRDITDVSYPLKMLSNIVNVDGTTYQEAVSDYRSKPKKATKDKNSTYFLQKAQQSCDMILGQPSNLLPFVIRYKNIFFLFIRSCHRDPWMYLGNS